MGEALLQVDSIESRFFNQRILSMFKTSMLLTTMLNQSPLKQALFIALSLSPFSASADWSAKLNHMVIKDDFLLARNVSHQATNVGLGYQCDFAKDYYLSTNAW